MTCQEYLARHSEYLDAEMGPDDVARMRAHAAACPSCARYDRVLRRGLALVRELEPVQPRHDVQTALYEHLLRAGEPRFARGGTLAASLVAAGLVAVFFWRAVPSGPDAPPRGGDVPAVAAYPTPDAGTHWNLPAAGDDIVGPGFPAAAAGMLASPFGAPLGAAQLRPAGVDLPGTYTPLVLDPPDYGQSAPVPGLPPTTYGR